MENKDPKFYQVRPIGWLRLLGEEAMIEVEEALLPALEGVELYSHLWLIFYFHENEASPERHLLKVHPCRNPANPLLGVFATRSPLRPNLLGLSVVRLRRREGNKIFIDPSDLRDGTPILDIKPYFPGSDCLPEAKAPNWRRRSPGQG